MTLPQFITNEHIYYEQSKLLSAVLPCWSPQNSFNALLLFYVLLLFFILVNFNINSSNTGKQNIILIDFFVLSAPSL